MLFLFFIACFGCNSKKERSNNQHAPEVLQTNKKESSLSFKKRGSEDLITELYKEKLKDSPDLLEIEELYSELNENKPDSLEDFHDYDSKNKQYYNSANDYLNSLQDSVLKKEIGQLLQNSLNRYNVRIGRLTSFENALDSTTLSSTNRHIILKVLVTLKMMEQYQKDNIPSTKPIEAVIKNCELLNTNLDSAINKN